MGQLSAFTLAKTGIRCNSGDYGAGWVSISPFHCSVFQNLSNRSFPFASLRSIVSSHIADSTGGLRHVD